MSEYLNAPSATDPSSAELKERALAFHDVLESQLHMLAQSQKSVARLITTNRFLTERAQFTPDLKLEAAAEKLADMHHGIVAETDHETLQDRVVDLLDFHNDVLNGQAIRRVQPYWQWEGDAIQRKATESARSPDQKKLLAATHQIMLDKGEAIRHGAVLSGWLAEEPVVVPAQEKAHYHQLLLRHSRAVKASFAINHLYNDFSQHQELFKGEQAQELNLPTENLKERERALQDQIVQMWYPVSLAEMKYYGTIMAARLGSIRAQLEGLQTELATNAGPRYPSLRATSIKLEQEVKKALELFPTPDSGRDSRNSGFAR